MIHPNSTVRLQAMLDWNEASKDKQKTPQELKDWKQNYRFWIPERLFFSDSHVSDEQMQNYVMGREVFSADMLHAANRILAAVRYMNESRFFGESFLEYLQLKLAAYRISMPHVFDMIGIQRWEFRKRNEVRSYIEWHCHLVNKMLIHHIESSFNDLYSTDQVSELAKGSSSAYYDGHVRLLDLGQRSPPIS